MNPLMNMQEIDLVSGLGVTYARSQLIDFTFQFMDDPVTLLIPYPTLDRDGSIAGLIQPFQYQVHHNANCVSKRLIFFIWIIIGHRFGLAL